MMLHTLGLKIKQLIPAALWDTAFAPALAAEPSVLDKCSESTVFTNRVIRALRANNSEGLSLVKVYNVTGGSTSSYNVTDGSTSWDEPPYFEGGGANHTDPGNSAEVLQWAASNIFELLGVQDTGAWSIQSAATATAGLALKAASQLAFKTTTGATVKIDLKPVCTDAPTKAPTLSPTKAPTLSPTKAPTLSPTKAPTLPPTKAPTLSPTKAPTLSPTKAPTLSPTKAPTDPDTPTIDTPTIDTPTIDTPTIDTPTIDTPTIDTSTIDTPTIDTPTIDTPTIDTPTGKPATADTPTTIETTTTTVVTAAGAAEAETAEDSENTKILLGVLLPLWFCFVGFLFWWDQKKGGTCFGFFPSSPQPAPYESSPVAFGDTETRLK
jgi:hypothetical protein